MTDKVIAESKKKPKLRWLTTEEQTAQRKEIQDAKRKSAREK